MKATLLSLFVGASLALVAASARADQEVDAGRITVVLKENAWVAGADLPYNHELMSAQGTFRGKARVLTLAARDGTPLGLIYVGASYPQVNVYSRRGECGTNATTYIRDLNDSKIENYRCLYAGGPYASAALLNNGLRYLSAINKATKLVAPEQGFFVHVGITARGGYLMDVEAILAPGFVGLPNRAPAGEVPALLQPSVAAWADALAEASLKALTSFSGKLVVPAIEFSAAAK